MQGILGQKLGMTAIYGELGTQIPVTAVYVGGNKVVGKRTQERDGPTPRRAAGSRGVRRWREEQQDQALERPQCHERSAVRRQTSDRHELHSGLGHAVQQRLQQPKEHIVEEVAE